MTTETSDTSDTSNTSEFGTGLCYNLGLYLAHADGLNTQIANYEQMEKKSPGSFSEASAVGLWIYGAADHLYELDPSSLDSELGSRVETFKTTVMAWRLPMDGQYKPTKEDAWWSIKEAKTLLRLIDESHGVITKEAEWA